MKNYTVYVGDSAAVATAFGGKPWAQALISAGALAGLTSVLLVFQLGQPRIFMAMARDGLLPQYFARIHPRFRTPHITTIWTGIVVGGVAMLTDIGSLADLTNIGTLFAFVLVCSASLCCAKRIQPGRGRSGYRSSRFFRFSAYCFVSRSCSVCQSRLGFGFSSGWRLDWRFTFSIVCATAGCGMASIPATQKEICQPSNRKWSACNRPARRLRNPASRSDAV